MAPPPPLVSQIQTGAQTCAPTAVLRMNKQSEAVGFDPVLTGWLQSPCAANAAGGPATALLNSRAAPKKVKALRMRIVNKAEPPPFVGQSVCVCVLEDALNSALEVDLSYQKCTGPA